MENLKTLVTATLAVFLLAATASFLSAQANDEENEPRQIRFVTTHGTGKVWSPHNPPEGLENPQGKLLDAIDAAAASEIETFLVDLGRLATTATLDETYYDHPGAVALRDREYAAAHATANDVAYGGVAGRGVRARPHSDDHFIGTFDAPATVRTGTPVLPSVVRDSETVGKVLFVAAGDREKISGLPWVYEHMRGGDAAEAVADALQEAEENGGLRVLLSDLSEEATVALVEAHPELDLVLTTLPGLSQTRVGRTHLIAWPGDNKLQVLTVELDADGRIASVEAEDQEWISPEDFAALVRPSLPQIGVSVRPPERLAERFELDAATISLDVFRNQPIADLSERENVYVYRVEKNEKDYHLIRVIHRPRVGRWISFDAVAQIDPETNTLVHLETNLPDYPLSFLSTRMADVFSYIYNVPADEWDFPAELIAGVEPQANEVLEALRRTLKANERLFEEQAVENQTD